MSEHGAIEIRRGGLSQVEVDAFRWLWACYLRELRDLGSEIRVTARTVDFFALCYRLYAARALRGCALLAWRCEPGGGQGSAVGVSLWGEPPSGQPPWDSDWAPQAQGWGTYVDPSCRKRGVSTALRQACMGEMRRLGIRTVVGVAHTANRVSYESSEKLGFTPHAALGVLRLEGEPR